MCSGISKSHCGVLSIVCEVAKVSCSLGAIIFCVLQRRKRRKKKTYLRIIEWTSRETMEYYDMLSH